MARTPPLGPVVGGVLGLGFVCSILYVLLPYSTTSELVLYNGTVALAFAMALSGIWRTRGTDRLIALFTSLAMAGWLSGELVWWWYSLHDQDPFPSIADALFLAGYVPLGVAAWLQASLGRAEPDRSAVLDALIMTLSLGIVGWFVLMEPHVADPETTSLEKAITMAYPLADLLILGLLVWILIVKAARSWMSILFCAGLIFTLSADLIWAWQNLRESYESGSWIDAVFLWGYLLLGAAVTRPSAIAQRDKSVPGRIRFAVLIVAILVPQALLLSEIVNLGGIGWRTSTLAIVVTTVVMLLIVVRMWRLLVRSHVIEQRRAEDRLSAVIHHSADTILLLDPQFRVSFASPAVRELTGLDPESVVGTLPSQLFVEDDREACARQLDNLSGMQTGDEVRLEGRIHSTSGATADVEGTGYNLLADEEVGAYVVTLRDVTVRRRLEDQLERRVFYDELTGVANRALFADRVSQALRRSQVHTESGVALLLIDIDDFKAVNDALGHAAGDELLRDVARKLLACLRPEDTPARLGGDEFAVLLEDVSSPTSAAVAADRVCEALRFPANLKGIEFQAAASVGMVCSVPGSTFESLLRDSEIAMYGAKAQGRGRVVMFDADLRDVARSRLTMRAELAEARRSDQFRMVYQPIYEMTGDQRLHGFEALLRWEHPMRGVVSPADFIPAAEESGDIIEIGHWVLEQACSQAALWNDGRSSALTMNANVSAVQFEHPGFVADVRRIIESTGLPPSLLTIELTESVMADEKAEALVEELRGIGLGIAIDDFGTGFSSLSYLHRFPVTAMKIDRAFISQMTRSNDNSLVRGIVAIADAMGLVSVAEGVETRKQLKQLAQLGCSLAQGYYLGRPEPPEKLAKLVAGA